MGWFVCYTHILLVSGSSHGCVAAQATEALKGTQPVMHAPAVDIFQRLASDLDTEGRYLFLNALANQLRFPNSHTHYFSCVLLFLFSEAQQVDCSPSPKCTLVRVLFDCV